jgi:hypothetical protein
LPVSTPGKTGDAVAVRDGESGGERHGKRQSEQPECAQPVALLDAFHVEADGGEPEHEASGERDACGRQIARPRRGPAARAGAEPGRKKHEKRREHAEPGHHPPSRHIRHRLAETEFRLLGAVPEQAPIAADRSLQQPLPRLIERLDQIDLPAFLLGRRHYAA